ncbi:hypothetical protein [Chondromyces crocatus]|uniref:Secreted protein n=1 Tax=Chondromyces crocatus TaxID=52 RepID=A0A0K1ETR4_CHOCO|nr:hypothetical protein [Chondromyces crocatus]AKT44023.1 uncharacterized protein CMC5_082610 [Chondromyces crocatus]
MRCFLAVGVLAASALLAACEQEDDASGGVDGSTVAEGSGDGSTPDESVVFQPRGGITTRRPVDRSPPVDPDLQGFIAAPPIHALDLSGLQPREPFTYVEMRQVIGRSTPQVQSSAGTKCGESRYRARCIAQFDALLPRADLGGFNRSCMPIGCSSYLAVNRGESNFVLAADWQLIREFGEVDSTEEALLLVSSAGYRWDGQGDVMRGGIREVVDGYEVIALRYTSTCAPIVEERSKLFVSRDGSISTLDVEEISRIPNLCI